MGIARHFSGKTVSQIVDHLNATRYRINRTKDGINLKRIGDDDWVLKCLLGRG